MANPRSTAQIAGHPIHPMVIAFPITCFVLTFLADIAFYQTSNDFWSRASLWLLGIGLIMAALAAATGLIDVFGDDRVRNLSDAWLHAGGNIIAVLIELYKWYSRYEHGSSVVVPAEVSRSNDPWSVEEDRKLLYLPYLVLRTLGSKVRRANLPRECGYHHVLQVCPDRQADRSFPRPR